MARGFNTTVGSGTTDAVQTALTTDNQQRSYFIHTYRRVDGASGGLARMLDQSTGKLQLLENNAAGTYFFHRTWTIATGQWSWARPSLTTWHRIGVTYDNGSATNDPIVYQDGSKLTVGSGLTELSAPQGTLSSTGTDPLIIGNASTGTRAWDGYLAECAVWNAILTDSEMFALCGGYSPLLIRTSQLVEYVPMVRANISYKLAAPTITGTAVQNHHRIIMPRRRQFSRKATAPSFIPAWAQNSNLPVIGAGTY